MTRRRDRNRRTRTYLPPVNGLPGDDLAAAYALTRRCPDCTADVVLTEAVDGVYQLVIAHDATCPALNRMENGA